MTTIKERYQKEEITRLSPYAAFSKDARRKYSIESCDMRGEYQRDRDRIIHSKAFRRLMHKTQVFISPQADHYRTRLTHTFEVMQIARSIARALRLNEDLTEAISLGHDLGHTPFGHAGERALDSLLKQEGGFKHNQQSVRVADYLERDGKGLNLTVQARDGILNHSTGNKAQTLEGKIVQLADKIAYVNHDIDDAVSAGILKEEEIPGDLRDVLGHSFKERIDTMIRSVICSSKGKNDIIMKENVYDALYALRSFLGQSVYFNPRVNGEEPKIRILIESLFVYYIKSPQKMPEEYQIHIVRDGVARAVADYIAGMTDRYAIEIYQQLFMPKSFSLSKNE